MRGAYAGPAAQVVVEHLRSLQLSAIELQAVHAFFTEHDLIERGLADYRGYNPIGLFAPHSGYAADRRPGGAVAEFKTMVKALHADESQLARSRQRRLLPSRRRRAVSIRRLHRRRGTTLELLHPSVLQLMMNSLC